MIELTQRFEELFAAAPRVFRGPGRVNLIGEHTDYSDGFVMPIAIQLSTRVAIAPRADFKFVLHSLSYSETIEFSLHEDNSRYVGPPRTIPQWGRYVWGVVAVLNELGHRLRGANVLIHTDIPIGAGLSSSAALEVTLGYGLLSVSDIPINRTHLALSCQRAENEFAGVRCGIMDQMIACHGRADHVVLLDTRNLAYELIPLPANVAVVVCNTMVKHDLAAGAYNTRRSECEAAARTLARSLRDVSLIDLEEHRTRLPENIFRRARHVVSENTRVRAGGQALKNQDLRRFGELMAQSHRSLRDDYEVSCPELEVMVQLAAKCDGVVGARMTGGGFGGCTINLVRSDRAEEFRNNIAREYEAQTGLRPEVYICSAVSGVYEES